ncbi:MAG: hypothetical protein HY854_18605 [Burkholderiales bacterium]|nr:hypothetical protein [Burkholderiales bacterium]
MNALYALFLAVRSPRTLRLVRGFAREANALLDAVTSPGSFVAEVEKLRKKH